MANVKIIVDGPLMDGHKVTFKAPCTCSDIEYLNVYYVKDDAQVSKSFVMKDSHGNDVTGIGNLFSEGAYVHVILDTTNNFAYLQNADTNGYIEACLSKRILGYDTPNAVDISSYSSYANTFTVPSDGVISVAVNGNLDGLNSVKVIARTYKPDGSALGSLELGYVTNTTIGESVYPGVGVFPVFEGQKVYSSIISTSGGLNYLNFVPYYYG